MLSCKIKHINRLGIVAAGLLLLTGLSSCEKVIDVKLNEADKKIVVDAVLTDQEGGCMVKLSKTKKFEEDNSFNGLAGAAVSIRDENGAVTQLTESQPGVYKHATLKGMPGKTYELTISVEGQTIKGSSTMPEPVHLDSVYIKKQKFFDEDEIFANVMFVDPGGIKNYYRVVQFINGVKSNVNFLLDDDLSDGKQFNSTLYFLPDDDKKKIKPGDVVTIEMQGIDAAVYKYWFSLDQSASGSSSSAAPSNPVSNLSGGVLGYFSAQVVQRQTVTAP